MSVQKVEFGNDSEYDVFISYPSSERTWVGALVSELEKRNIFVFQDEKDIKLGMNFVRTISEALRQSLFLVLILSNESASRPWIEREWTAFTALHGATDRIFPILLDPVRIPTLLSPIQSIKATDRNTTIVAQAIESSIKESSIGSISETSLFRHQSDLAFQLASEQASRFRRISRYPFQNIDNVSIGDALELYADRKVETGRTHKRIQVNKIVEIERAAILFGGPGAGKTTTLQQIVKKYSEKNLAGTYYFIPFYVDLKWYYSTLYDLLESTIFDLCPNAIASEVSKFLLTAPISYYLDSFDEAPNSAHLIREINSLLNKNQSARFIIASRPSELIQSLGLAIYELAPLNRAQIREILELYLSKQLDASQIQQVYEGIENYALFVELGNPMMLWFFSLTVRDTESMQRVEFLSKGKIFSRVIEDYFLSIWETKSLKSWSKMSRRYTRIKTDLLSILARNMLEEDDKVVVTEQWVLDKFVAYLQNRYPNVFELAQEILDQILCHHLIEGNGDRLAFWHKSLRNFFAARSMINNMDSTELATFVRQERWNEPIIMLAGIYPKFAEVIGEVALANAAVGLDCVTFSQFSQDPDIVELVVHVALDAFLSARPLDERVRIIQHFAALYRKTPAFVYQATYSYLHCEESAELRPKYESIIAHKPIFEEVVLQIRSRLGETDIQAKIEKRIETFFSFALKARKYGIERVDDIFGIRLITNSKKTCYETLGVVHGSWKPHPGRFRDYISIPKDNFYQALHSNLTIQSGFYVKIIIQTNEMHKLSRKTWYDYYSSEYGDVILELEKRQAAENIDIIPVKALFGETRNIIVLNP